IHIPAIKAKNTKPHADWPLEKLFRILIGGAHQDRKAELRWLAKLPVLADTWRKRAEQLAAKQ
ncbi:MAG: hypothetical protein AAF067_13250, partial [Pseudomonadota bacterium]